MGARFQKYSVFMEVPGLRNLHELPSFMLRIGGVLEEAITERRDEFPNTVLRCKAPGRAVSRKCYPACHAGNGRSSELG